MKYIINIATGASVGISIYEKQTQTTDKIVCRVGKTSSFARSAHEIDGIEEGINRLVDELRADLTGTILAMKKQLKELDRIEPIAKAFKANQI